MTAAYFSEPVFLLSTQFLTLDQLTLNAAYVPKPEIQTEILAAGQQR